MSQTDTFTVGELYLLAESLGVNIVFGLPDKATQQLVNPDFLEEATAPLTKKGIISEDLHLTKGGFLIAKALKSYIFSEEYVRINNLMVGFSSDKVQLFVLVEVKEGELYKLLVFDKLSFLRELYTDFPLIQREPKAIDQDYTKKKLRNAQKRVLKHEKIPSQLFNLEIFKLTDPPRETSDQWLFFEHDQSLIGIEVSENTYYEFSQYYFMKQVFDALHLPYTAKDISREISREG